MLKRLYSCALKNDKWLTVFFWFSLIFCFFQTIILSDVPEVFRYGHELGNYLSAIAYSYIASFIFYRVALKIDRKNRKSHNSYVGKRARMIINVFERLLFEMSNETNISSNNINEILANIYPKNKTKTLKYIDRNTGDSEFYTWIAYILDLNNMMKNYYAQALPFLSVVNVSLAESLNNIFDLQYFTICDVIAVLDMNLSVMENEFIEMKSKLGELESLIGELGN